MAKAKKKTSRTRNRARKTRRFRGETLRIGIIGIGGMGSHHARYLTDGKVPGAALTAVCDIDPARLDAAKKNFGDHLETFDNGDDFFAADVCDAVIIATPHYFHPPYAIQAFANGVHALSEKPAGVYTAQVREMNEAAAASDCVFGLMFNQRTTPIYRKLRSLVQSGELGEIKRTNWIITDWFRSQSYYDSGGWRATWAGEGGGVLLNQCPHNLDLWQWTCGMPARVRAFCAFGKYHDIEVEDDVTAYVEYANGATGLFITTTGEAPGTNRLEVTCDRGKVVVEHGKLTFHRTIEPVSKFCAEYQGGFGSPETWTCDVPVGGGGEQHIGITKDWVYSIRTGAPLTAPGEEGIKSLELSNAMLLSAWTDQWIDLPVDEKVYHRELQKQIKKAKSAGKKKKKKDGSVMNVDGTF